MTKAEFYDQIEDFSDLLNFCVENGCDHIVENVRDSESFDDWVWDVLETNRTRWFWHDVRDVLQRIDAPASDYFVTPEGIGDMCFSELWEEDLDDYKDYVIDWGDGMGFWDEEEDEDDDWITIGDDPIEDKDPGDVCWDVSVDLSILIGVG